MIGYAKIKFVLPVAVQASEEASTSFERMPLSHSIECSQAYCHGKSTRFDSCIQHQEIGKNCMSSLYAQSLYIIIFQDYRKNSSP